MSLMNFMPTSMARRAIHTCLLLLGLMMAAGTANAELKIDITRGTVEPLPIAITKFIGDTVDEANYGKSISDVIAQDLERSGLFKPADSRAFIQSAEAMSSVPRFGDWRVIDVQALVQGRAEIVDDGRLRIEFRLWDVFAETQMVGLAYFTVPDNWRRVAHIIADSIYKRLTGEDGYFDTRVVFIAQQSGTGACRGTTPMNPFGKRLAIMDQDGENRRYLTDGSSLVLTPRFSPTLQEITYMSYHGNVPRVYIFNIDTGHQEVVGDFPGMTFSPRFSYDGETIIMSMAKDGNSDIYTLDLRTREDKQLTTHSGIDTSPSFSPDGKFIAFNSDRGGAQQLYVMSANGKNVRRISHGKGRYATPVWSPRGDLIAFTKLQSGRFFIGVMRPDGSGERLLAEDFKIEAPTWAPNGRVLMYFRKDRTNDDGSGGRSRLFTIDLTGDNEREVTTLCDASDPAWSPLNP
ncbi:MAG: Tol-Pal system protein TolB [Rhodospirillales bacterium]|jgi:TolB protein|nr:Tol-Pal system protein TolB [Rhodospirillales bacterium]MBT4039325.1 Tol-Pal system protein TolB [Rhodospirillales bacterium]MBT4625730.1 Tol-Pal system protein TolB [Rhodospirillales bacterium]MBT5352711.1 Tol-Pal system protein TolB [Rhodospirillales bacterium]MBT5521624.1 Tol-Pal system protein TolB [Rhodospirillales bacterium]